VGRIAYARPQTQLGRRKIDSEPVPVDVRRGWAAVVDRVFADKTDKSPVEGPGWGGSVGSVSKIHNAISLSPGASGALKELREELEPRLGEDGDLHSVSDWISRHHGRVARIAGLLHLVEHDARDPISEATMRSALRIGEYLLAHSLLALTESDPLTGRALRWLAHHGQAMVTQRELHRGVLSHGKAEDADALLGKLVELGALRVRASGEDPNNGRPPSTEYYVNPNLLSR
jgi:hypothetical protein